MISLNMIKNIFVTINIVFLILGLSILTAGVVMKSRWDPLEGAFDDVPKYLNFDPVAHHKTIELIVICFASFVIVKTILGCVGACYELKVVLFVYVAILIMLLCGEFIFLVTFPSQEDVEKHWNEPAIAEALNNRIRTKYYENSTANSQPISAMFQVLGCCGVSNYSSTFPTDETRTKNFGFIADPERKTAGIKYEVIPITCCRNFDYKDTLTAKVFSSHAACLDTPDPNDKLAFTKGCLDELIRSSQGLHLTGFLAVTIVVQIFAGVLSVILCRQRDEF